MSNPILPSTVVTQAFASVVVSLPDTHSGRGRDRITAGIEKLREETRSTAARIGYGEGQSEGFEVGYAEGLRLGREEAARNAAVEAQLVGEALASEVGALHARIESEWRTFLATSESAMVAQCLATVRALLDAELQIGRESAVEIVRRCLGEMIHATSIRVRVAASDLPNLAERVRDERVEFVADGSITAGCVVESSSGIVDGTLDTSLRLLESAWAEAA